ncbi:hypothetical protein MKA27_12935 [[Clostridium] innocuum]|uniref:hypothetical protein n=1 Tax=Clostridium innocuum TaxID=1522 RepID=UPI000D6D2F31|nr:hypothetical protein [[Clostridium] innocuum]MCR0315468.1 hypothetical protein [[Clostridium] innocuum]MCR0369766.1 hypothetical protein [[Clostridium] innocuum]MCR0374723.1 hypothetical protein [[Clostridium] innocuum]MCR0559719.1 hypothetical protein [[Clostridium] innocuum]MCR0602587.1 hypothetical protein [[Clostridium] innocuum]
MKKNMIEQIIKTMELHELDSIAVFCSKKYTIQGLSAAIALTRYLNQLGLPTHILMSNDIVSTNELYVQKPATKHFLAIAVDCKKTTSIDSLEYENSNIIAQVYAPITGKGFGVLNFIDSSFSCTAELIHRQLYEYCKKHQCSLPMDIDLLLYFSYGFTEKFYQSHRKTYQYPIRDIIKATHDSSEIIKYLKMIDDLLDNMVLKENHIVINMNADWQASCERLFLECFNELTDMIPFVLCLEGNLNSEVLLFANENTLNRLHKQIAAFTASKTHKVIKCVIETRKKDRFIKQISRFVRVI